jgi:spore maturation protein CgeB
MRAMDEYRSDLSHLGTYAEDRQPVLSTLMIEPAIRLPNKRFLIGGPQYPPMFPWQPNIYYRSHVAQLEHPVFYCSSKFTLNVTRQAMARMGYCPSNRLFEAAACAVPTISDSWEGLGEFFAPGSEVVVARCAEDVIGALNMGEAERSRIAGRARERVLSEHTATHRAIQIEATLAAAMNPISTDYHQ